MENYENIERAYLAQKVLIWNTDKTKFLMLLRGKTAPTGPLTWDFPGGDVDKGEELEEGIQREVKEEAGISVGNLKYDYAFLNDPDGNGEKWLTLFYEAVALSTDIQISFEHDDFKWYTYEEVSHLPMKPKIKMYLDRKFT